MWRRIGWYIGSNILKEPAIAHPFYELWCVIPCVGNITEEKPLYFSLNFILTYEYRKYAKNKI
jgi:hypothetical protein